MGWSSIMLIRWALRSSGLPSTDTLVLIALASRAGHAGAAAGTCYPSQGTIAADTRLARRTVNRSIRRLLQAGLVEALDGGGTSGNCITYRLTRGETQDHTPTPEDHTGETEDLRGGETQDLRGCDPVSQGVRSSGVGGETEDHTKGTKKGTKKGNSKRTDTARRIPDDWQPSDQVVLWARRHGLAKIEIAPAVEEFRDYWLARSDRLAVKRNWDAAFRSRLRGNRWIPAHPSYRLEEREPPASRPPPQMHGDNGEGLEMLRRVARGEISYEELPPAMQPAAIRAIYLPRIEQLRAELAGEQQLALRGAS